MWHLGDREGTEKAAYKQEMVTQEASSPHSSASSPRRRGPKKLFRFKGLGPLLRGDDAASLRFVQTSAAIPLQILTSPITL